jgi:multimeric flavodoxin WrbA
MKICEKCKLSYDPTIHFCPNCGSKLVIPKKTDAYLMKYLGVDKKTLNRFKEVRNNTINDAKKLSKKNKKIIAIGISGSSRDRFDMAGEESNSEFLLEECLKEMKKLGAETELIKLRKCNIKPCKCCYSTTNAQCHFHCSCYPKGTKLGDDMSNVIYDKLLKADIIIFATPVNNFKISSLMALFLDRCISMDGSLEPADPKATKNKELNIKHTKFIELMADQKVPGSGFLRRFMGKVAGVIVTGHEEGASMTISDLFMTLNHFGMIFSPWSNMYAMSSILNGTYKDKKMVTSPEYIEEAQQIGRNAMNTAKLLRDFNKLNWEHDYSSN